MFFIILLNNLLKNQSQNCVAPNKKLRKAAHSSLTVIAISNSTKVHKKSKIFSLFLSLSFFQLHMKRKRSEKKIISFLHKFTCMRQSDNFSN